MGSSSSRHGSKRRSARRPKQPRPTLSEHDAWGIALAWCDQLRGCVLLETDWPQLATTIIPTFEWVTFVFNAGAVGCDEQSQDHERIAGYARAATIVWFALSCCEGYSGVENPQFWRRVFIELQYSKDLPTTTSGLLLGRPHDPITAAVHFFDRAGKPFPRVRLVAGSYRFDSLVKSIFLNATRHTDAERDARLKCLLATLQPFIRESRVKRRVPVEVDSWLAFSSKTSGLPDPSRSGEVEPDAVVGVASLMEFPQLFLLSVALSSVMSAFVHERGSFTFPIGAEIRLAEDLPSFVQDHRLCRGLLDQLQANVSGKRSRRWCIMHLRAIQTSDLSYAYLGILCSALPHMQSIRSVIIPPHRYSKGTPARIAPDWAWLGYAIFHPDAEDLSGFFCLVVDLADFSVADAAALDQMSRGNNLRGDSKTSYLEGLVRCGTHVKTTPAVSEEPSLHTFTAESWVSLCVAAADSVQHQGWVCVVVPGFGSGWIREQDIIETRNRSPGVSCIRALRVKGNWENAVVNAEALLGLLGTIGGRLSSLHLEFNRCVSAPFVRTVLRLCPSLKRLRVHHDGSFWADEAYAMEIPRLEELELSVKNYIRDPVHLREIKPSCLPHLKVLLLLANEGSRFRQHESVLVRFLSNQPVLQYLSWSNDVHERGTWPGPPSYHKTQATREFLRNLPVKSQYFQGEFRLDCRLAFLSVIQQKAEKGNVPSLPQDVNTLIFQYATSPSLRDIHIVM